MPKGTRAKTFHLVIVRPQNPRRLSRLASGGLDTRDDADEHSPQHALLSPDELAASLLEKLARAIKSDTHDRHCDVATLERFETRARILRRRRAVDDEL